LREVDDFSVTVKPTVDESTAIVVLSSTSAVF